MGALKIDGKPEKKEVPNFTTAGELIRFVMADHYHYPNASRLTDQQIKSLFQFRGKTEAEIHGHYEGIITYKGQKHQIVFDEADVFHAPQL